MPRVRSTAVMEIDLEWEGYVPDHVPENERWLWIKENVDGGEFYKDRGREAGGWRWGHDVEVIEDDQPAGEA